MAAVFGNSAKIYLGAFDITTYFRRFSIALNKGTYDTTTFGDTSREFIEGIRSGSISLDGLFDHVDDGPDEQLRTLFESATLATPITLSPAADDIGNIAYVATPIETAYGIDHPFDDVVGITAELQPSPSIYRGHWLHNLAAVASTGDSATSVDNGAASSGGGRSNLHVTAFDGTNVTIIVKDSADDVSFAAVTGGGHAQLIGTGSESLLITGAIRRYALYNVAGTFTSVTFAHALGRRN